MMGLQVSTPETPPTPDRLAFMRGEMSRKTPMGRRPTSARELPRTVSR
jgi:hypothetical protein